MSPAFESEQDKTIPLSYAHIKRRPKARIETSATQLEEILTKVVNKEVTEKIVRLEKSIDLMVAQFKAVQSGESEDSALRVTTDLGATDIALANIKLNLEDYYIYTCAMIAEELHITNTIVLRLVKQLSLRGNDSYHRSLKIGVKSFVQKYSEAALVKIKQELDSEK